MDIKKLLNRDGEGSDYHSDEPGGPDEPGPGGLGGSLGGGLGGGLAGGYLENPEKEKSSDGGPSQSREPNLAGPDILDPVAGSSTDRRPQPGQSAPRRYRCDQCSSTFASRTHMTVHVRTVHEGDRPYKCEWCDRCFGTKGTKNRHVRLVHFQERRYVCQLCHRAFSTLACQRRHHSMLHPNQEFRGGVARNMR